MVMSRLSPLHYYLLIILSLMVFLREEITWPTLMVMAFVMVIKFFKINFPGWMAKVLGLGLFVLAFVEHGRFVNPEMGLNLLLAVVTLKLYEAKEPRDWRMLTLAVFLLFATGALFVKTPLYLFTAIAGSSIAIYAMILCLGESLQLNWRRVVKWMLSATPLAIILFILIPRFGGSLWTPPKPPEQGKIGFSEEARPGDVAELQPSGEVAFHASIRPLPNRDQLYWRGMTLSGHDGWNWFPLPRDEAYGQLGPAGRVASAQWWQQDIIHKTAARRAMGLDVPKWWSMNGKEVETTETATLRFLPYSSIRRYRVTSAAESPAKLSPILIESSHKAKLALPKELKDFKGSLTQAMNRLQEFFTSSEFTYHLSPGKITSVKQFMMTKKGWCTHYASTTALILRHWGFPARLVSGYLGGEYNPMGQYFKITEDDAHVWVEAFDGENWLRIDPTIWIIPERIQLSGDRFFKRKEFALSQWLKLPDWYRETQSWIESVNFKFLVWSEDYDREEQRSVARKLNLDLAQFYLISIWVIISAILGYWAREWWRDYRKSLGTHHRAKVWQRFIRELEKGGISDCKGLGPRELAMKIKLSSIAEKDVLLSWLRAWELMVYRDDQFDEKKLKNYSSFGEASLGADAGSD